jgi:hypothetical protein
MSVLDFTSTNVTRVTRAAEMIDAARRFYDADELEKALSSMTSAVTLLSLELRDVCGQNSNYRKEIARLLEASKGPL